MTDDITVPLDVPRAERRTFQDNYQAMTKGSGRLMLLAGDQKLEHLNNDFFGEGISEDDADPAHLFRIAGQAKIGAFATQFGLVARYGMDHPQVPYLIKLNSKTHLVKTSQAEPVSRELMGVDQAVKLGKDNDMRIVGVGYTVYLGSEHEAVMLREAAQMVHRAHRHGLLTILWMYPRGRAVADERDPHLVAGAAGAAACLGADFAKVNYPEGPEAPQRFREAVRAAGRTKVICAGGERMEAEPFLRRLHDQIHISGAAGNATGRNVHQRPLDEAVRFCNAIYGITVEGISVQEAMKIYWGDPGA
jgi:fructose-bisphosphate aldolase/6-deoxy-5-ketofructose 1-phosphate synthase